MKTAAFACALSVVLAPDFLEAHKPTTTRFTYHRDVRPIFESKCGSCHRGGGVAPMSLLRYKDAYPWAVSIKNRVLALNMPPWFADERHGAFRHRSSLTAGELNTIVDWCLGGTPEGDPVESPAPLPGSPGDPPEEPDLLLELHEPFVLAADRGEAFHEVTFSRGFDRERLLGAIEFQPQSPNVVRSALVFVVPKGGKLAPVHLISSWLPGEGREVWPAGRGVRVPAGSSIVLRLHYKKTWLDEGKEVSDKSRLALYFRNSKSKPVETLAIVATGTEPTRSNGPGFERIVVAPVPGPVEVIALLPRLEARLDSLFAEALLPDGESRPLIRLQGPEPDWPRKFWLEEPLSLPKGSRIRLTLRAAEEGFLAAPHALLLSVLPH